MNSKINVKLDHKKIIIEKRGALYNMAIVDIDEAREVSKQLNRLLERIDGGR